MYSVIEQTTVEESNKFDHPYLEHLSEFVIPQNNHNKACIYYTGYKYGTPRYTRSRDWMDMQLQQCRGLSLNICQSGVPYRN